jgi:hypothetical protein
MGVFSYTVRLALGGLAMLDESEFFDDSGDPELAFVRLEGKFRQKLNVNLAQLDEQQSGNSAYAALYIEYINHTLAAADALGLDILEGHQVPSHSIQNIWEVYQDFTTAVDHYAVKIKIAHAQGRRAYSVVLSAPEKEKLRHYVSQIKTVIDQSSLPQAKKEDLYGRINDFLEAIDRDRTSLQAFSEFIISAAHTTGEVADALEPTWKWMRRIAELFGYRFDEQTRSLPAPRRRERIEGSKQRRLPPPQRTSEQTSKKLDLDDDIPF